jgi:TOBE domain
VKIAERAYLGEFWDYVAVPLAGGMRLRVTAPPLDVYQAGETAWLELDPQQMTPIV